MLRTVSSQDPEGLTTPETFETRTKWGPWPGLRPVAQVRPLAATVWSWGYPPSGQATEQGQRYPGDVRVETRRPDTAEKADLPDGWIISPPRCPPAAVRSEKPPGALANRSCRPLADIRAPAHVGSLIFFHHLQTARHCRQVIFPRKQAISMDCDGRSPHCPFEKMWNVSSTHSGSLGTCSMRRFSNRRSAASTR
jgi:hypothetical protein